MSIDLKYFVLKPRSKYPGDPYAHASRCALLSFAIHIDKTNPDLARELRIWVEEESRLENELIREQDKDNEGPECSPYVDYLGTPIYEGSKVKFSDGDVGTVMIRKHIKEDDARWVIKLLDVPIFFKLSEMGGKVVVVDDGDAPPRKE